MTTAARGPRNHWLDADADMTRAAETAQRLASPRTPKTDLQPEAGVAAAAGLEQPGDPAPARAIVSTAAGYTIGEPPTGRIIRPQQNDSWAAECWAHYDAMGELHYVANQYARAVSRGRLYIATKNEDGETEEVTSGEAKAVSDQMLGGETMASDLLYLSAIQQFVTGQSLITVSDNDGWDAFSCQDFTVDRSSIRSGSSKGRALYKVDAGTGSEQPLAKGTLTIHMWDRHPGKAYTVDCSVRPALPYLRELARLDQYVQALLLSRIALSGILQLPPNTEVVVPPELRDIIGDTRQANGSGLMHVLASIGVQNISNPGAASAVLPILLQLANPDQKLEHLTLDQPLTSEINSFREINLKRLAMSLDLAPEALSGFSNVKYSNADWIMTESVQTHILRRLNAFASALTRHYVVPLLDDKHFVAVDASDLEADDDRTEAAIQLYDRGEIDGKALRKKAQMADATPPEGMELLRQLAVRAATVNPSLLPVLAPLLGLESINLTDTQRQALEQAGPGDDGSSLNPEPINNENTDPDEIPDADVRNTRVRPPQALPAARTEPARARVVDQVPDALVAACDVVVCSALASAGSRWRKRQRARAAMCRGTEPSAVYLVFPLAGDAEPGQSASEHAAQLVADRWPQVPRIAALHAADPSCLQSTLARYVTGLIVDQKAHHPNHLTDALADCVLAEPVNA